MTMRATRVLLVVGSAMVFFAAGVLIEEIVDGADVSSLAVAVAIAGALVGALTAYVWWRENR